MSTLTALPQWQNGVVVLVMGSSLNGPTHLRTSAPSPLQPWPEVNWHPPLSSLTPSVDSVRYGTAGQGACAIIQVGSEQSGLGRSPAFTALACCPWHPMWRYGRGESGWLVMR